MAGKRRCRMHGGARGTGAPQDNQNALKTGLHTAEAKSLRAYVREMTRRTKDLENKI